MARPLKVENQMMQQSNYFTTARYDYTAQEKRILYRVAEKAYEYRMANKEWFEGVPHERDCSLEDNSVRAHFSDRLLAREGSKHSPSCRVTKPLDRRIKAVVALKRGWGRAVEKVSNRVNHCSCGLTPELSRPARCDSARPRPRSGLGLNELLALAS